MQIWSPIVASMTGLPRCCDRAAATCTPVFTAKVPFHTSSVACSSEGDVVGVEDSRSCLREFCLGCCGYLGCGVLTVSVGCMRSSHQHYAEASLQGGERCRADAVLALHADDDDVGGVREQAPEFRAVKAVGRALVHDCLGPGDLVDQFPAGGAAAACCAERRSAA